MQTADSTVLLPCQALSRGPLSCAFLPEHQTKAKTAAAATEAAAGMSLLTN